MKLVRFIVNMSDQGWITLTVLEHPYISCCPLENRLFVLKIPVFNSSPLDNMAAVLADDNFKCIFLNEKLCILIQISLKFVPKGPIDNNPALV